MRAAIERRVRARGIVQAQRWVHGGHACGKVIVTVDGASA